jgi:hypothetical protein
MSDEIGEPRRLKNPIEVKRTDTVHYWRCAHCGVVRNVVVPEGETPPEVPPGWIYHLYRSARFPRHDALAALGCCYDHAAQAAQALHDDSVRAVEEGFIPHE